MSLAQKRTSQESILEYRDARLGLRPPLLQLYKFRVFHPLLEFRRRLRTNGVVDSVFLQERSIGLAVKATVARDLANDRPRGRLLHPIQTAAQHLRVRPGIAAHQFPIHDHAARRFPQQQLTAELHLIYKRADGYTVATRFAFPYRYGVATPDR